MKVALKILLICTLLAGNPAAAANSGWLLSQKNLLYGKLNVYVWKDGVRAVSLDSDYTFSCCAPDWDAVMYTEKRKLYYIRPYSNWSKNGFRTAISIQDNSEYYKWPIRFVTKKKDLGIETNLYAFPYRYENGKVASLRNGNVGTYLVTSELKTSKQVEQFLQALYDLPPLSGVPLRFHKIGKRNSYGFGLDYNKKEERHALLETKEIKQVAVVKGPSSTKGYKLVGEAQIIVPHGQLDNVMIQMWGEKK